jgi:hypothetical protein
MHFSEWISLPSKFVLTNATRSSCWLLESANSKIQNTHVTLYSRKRKIYACAFLSREDILWSGALSKTNQSYITTYSQSANPSWYQAPIWDLRPIFPHSLFIFLIGSGLLMWGALSDEKSGLYFSVYAGHRQRSPSQI